MVDGPLGEMTSIGVDPVSQGEVDLENWEDSLPPNLKRRVKAQRKKRAGRELALRHIEEAEKLTEELGGADQDVKRYFFNLTRRELEPILDEYERLHSTKARTYAEEALPLWRSGKRRMSGEVATRLFGLLPKYMTEKEKQRLIRNLWEHSVPSSKMELLIGPSATAVEVSDLVQEHFSQVIDDFRLPESLNKRFQWLSNGDSRACQVLMNYFLKEERHITVKSLDNQLPRILKFFNHDDDVHFRMTQTLNIGKHELQLIFDPEIELTELHHQGTWNVRKRNKARQERKSKFKATLALIGVGIIIVLLLSQWW